MGVSRLIFVNVLIVLMVLHCGGVQINGEDNTEDKQFINTCNKPLLLTPYIEAGKIRKAQKLARVNPLDSKGVIKSYSGYLTVNKTCNSNLFFWFFPSPSEDPTAPVTLWLQGGPGASSLFGLFNEIGPFYVDEHLKLQSRNYSWNSVSSLLFIDNPVGTGYSFTDKDECYATNEDDVRNDLYEALLQFFKLFPQLQKNDFYLFGESYAGKYIPAIAYSIHENNPKSREKINLKGLGIGDGLTDPINMLVYGDYVYQLGLVDESGKMEIHKLEEQVAASIKNGDWEDASEQFSEVGFALITSLDGNLSPYNYVNFNSGFDDNYVKYVVNNSTRCAIHVGNTNYSSGMKVYTKLYSDIAKSVKPWIEILIESYPILFYNGQFDIIVGFPLTRNFVNRLDWSGADGFKDKQQMIFYNTKKPTDVCGYIKSFKNLHLALVRNAGHMVPGDQPECGFELYKSFLFDRNNTLVYT